MSLKKKSIISSILLATFFIFVDRFTVRKGGQFYEAVLALFICPAKFFLPGFKYFFMMAVIFFILKK